LTAREPSTAASGSMKIAIACSGLGHVQRGVEAWAADLAKALRNRGVDVSLFSGDRTECAVALSCAKRGGRAAILTAKMFRHLGGWRYGLGSPYEVEQTTFSLNLWRHVRRGFDLIHVQDPLVGQILDRLNRVGLSEPRAIFANGTGERSDLVKQFSVVQHLTAEAAVAWNPLRPAHQSTFAIPNFIDVATFAPGDSAAARRQFDLPQDALVFLCCAAIRKIHKRIDYLIREFAMFLESHSGPAVLVVAGGREPDTDAMMSLGRDLLGDRVQFFVDVPRARMPELYKAADVFVLPSLFEQFGIVLLEAMATGLPVICNEASAFRSIVGSAGLFRDLSGPGALAESFASMCASALREPLASAARPHVCAHFSTEVVVTQILDMYQCVAGSEVHAFVG
jgi:1,2-diacylglycerol 3-alpha-glucosyltransferase